MANFRKSDLLYENEYVWKRDQGDGPYIGKADRIKLDRDEGYEVLYFANSNLAATSSIADLHQFEKLIRQVPSGEVRKTEILKFIRLNWS